MNWFSRLFNRDDDEYVEDISVPLSTILRWYLFDTAVSDHSVIGELIGLSPISEEGESKELEDSEERLSKLAFILPFIDSMSDISANFMTAIHCKEAGKVQGIELDDEDVEAMISVYKLVSISTLIGTFSIALNLGLIQPNGVASEHYDTEGFFDEQF